MSLRSVHRPHHHLSICHVRYIWFYRANLPHTFDVCGSFAGKVLAQQALTVPHQPHTFLPPKTLHTQFFFRRFFAQVYVCGVCGVCGKGSSSSSSSSSRDSSGDVTNTAAHSRTHQNVCGSNCLSALELQLNSAENGTIRTLPHTLFSPHVNSSPKSAHDPLTHWPNIRTRSAPAC